MIEGIYFFGEQLRWNLGWPNPNVGGAFIAMLWAFTFSLNTALPFDKLLKRLAKVLLTLLELTLVFLLCKTYSRGAMFALSVGFLYVCMIQLWGSGFSAAKGFFLKSWIPRILAFVAMLAGTGFWARMAPSYVTSDASVGNRMILWRSGLEMMSLQPWSGWGIGQSGTQFMHWFQPLDETARYAGMVNSYLHIGVERGMGVLFLWSFLGCLGVCTPWVMAVRNKKGNKGSRLAVSGGAVLSVFMAANVFNTLWVFPKLWIPVIVALLAVVGGCVLGTKEGWKKAVLPGLVCAFVFSSVSIGGLYVTGRILNRSRPEKFTVQNHLIIFQPGQKSKEAPHRVILYPETAVLGEDWGKEVRRLALSLNNDAVQVIAPLALTGSEFDESLVPKGEGGWTVITSSTKPLENQRLTENAAEIFLLHPVERPSETLDIPSGKLEILLPGLDISGTDGLWRREAKKRGWTVNKSGSFSPDVRSVWPGVLSGHFHFSRL